MHDIHTYSTNSGEEVVQLEFCGTVPWFLVDLVVESMLY